MRGKWGGERVVLDARVVGAVNKRGEGLRRGGDMRERMSK